MNQLSLQEAQQLFIEWHHMNRTNQLEDQLELQSLTILKDPVLKNNNLIDLKGEKKTNNCYRDVLKNLTKNGQIYWVCREHLSRLCLYSVLQLKRAAVL